MHNKFDQFIGIFENAATAEDCNKIIKHFDNVQDLNLTVKRTKFENINSTLKNNNINYQCIKSMAELEKNIDGSLSIKKLILE